MKLRALNVGNSHWEYDFGEPKKMFIYIALELCHCDLDSFVSQRENFELQDREIMLQCATGLEHIHSLG